MPRGKRPLASDLTLAEIKKLLAAKQKMVALEAKRAELASELAAVDTALRKIAAGGAVAPAVAKPRRKPARKRGPKPGRPARKVARRATTAVAKKSAKRVARAPKRRAGKRGGATLQEVVAGLIRKNGKPMAFQEILSTITKRKLVKTRSKNFANVLRRTISTSAAIKRVGRGTYAVAK